MRTVYLDNNATTPVHPEVFEAMRPYYTEQYGNPSSPHRQGTGPAAALRAARAAIAAFLGCDGGEVIFTSCGTESDNLAIRGVLEGEKKKMHIVTTAVEHSAVLNPFKRMKSLGHDVTFLGVNADGMVDLDELRVSLRDDTSFVSIMFANNETGVLFPMKEIATMVKDRCIPLHVDAVQAIGKVPFSLRDYPIDMIAMSAHKFHGPKGVGALFVRRGTRCAPIFLGGSQENGRRPGTENVAGAVAMARACEMAAAHVPEYGTRVRELRDRFESEIVSRVPDTVVNGTASPRLPNTSNVCFRGIDGHDALLALDEVGICASAGSACKSGIGAPSHVLAAMGRTEEEIAGSMRFSLSTLTTAEDVDYAIEHIPGVVERLRAAARHSTKK